MGTNIDRPSGGSLTSFQRAQQQGFVGTEAEFYQQMSDRMMGNQVVDGTNGIRVDGGDIKLTLGDGSRQMLTA